MGNWYTNRTDLKSALGIPASTTGDHAHLDGAMEAVSRLLDDYVGYHLYPSVGTRYYNPKDATALSLNYPITAVDAVQISSDGGANYGTTFATNAYYMRPYNATEESPKQPWWEIEIAVSATAVFLNYQRSARVTGTWGYFNQTKSSSAVLTGDLASGTTSFAITNATALAVGQTILMGTEQMFITRSPVTATGAHTSTVDVLRAQNGTTNSTHSGSTAISIYEYPIVERAALYQAAQDYRAKDVPFGNAGGDPFGGQQPRMAGGLHPFTRRMLDGFRIGVVA